ncbi:MAG: ArgE/DapE family deacylase [Candidatus Ratteibacteria bacterium]
MNIRKTVEKHLRSSADFLKEIILIPSVSGTGEGPVQDYIQKAWSSFGKADLVPVPENFTEDPEYSFADTPLDYSNRKNLVLRYPSKEKGPSLIINSHSDVVPPGDWKEAWNPREENGIIHGRGACDAKGQVAVMDLALKTLHEIAPSVAGNLSFQVVIEEEVGGNGALAMVRQEKKADGVIVLEPTDLKLHPANRGAIWYRLDVEGKPVHMARIWDGVNALEKTVELMKVMREYEKGLIEESRHVPLFEKYRQPVQLNFGIISGGKWPATVCDHITMEGGVGFLPNKTLAQIKQELHDALASCPDQWAASHFTLSFPKLHNDAFATDISHPLVVQMAETAKTVGLDPELSGWIASCDARLYARLGNMPTIVFGAGKLEDAHSAVEKIEINDIAKAAEMLVTFLLQWFKEE